MQDMHEPATDKIAGRRHSVHAILVHLVHVGPKLVQGLHVKPLVKYPMLHDVHFVGLQPMHWV